MARKKVKRRQREGWIRLSSKGASILPYFFKSKPLPNWKGWTQNMERWAERAGLDPEGLGTQDNNEDLGVVACLILSRQSVGSVSEPGSYTDDSLSHYLNMSFTPSDKESMVEWVAGWEK